MARFSDSAAYIEDQKKHPEEVQSQNAVLWSDDKDRDTGLSRNKLRAEQYAESEREAGRPASTIEMTPGGRRLQDDNLYKDPQFGATPGERADKANEVWRHRSAQFAENTSGEVNTFCCGAHRDSVFRKVEMERTINNPAVTKVNGLDRAELQRSYDPKDPDKTYYRIADAELARDRQALQRGDTRFALPDETPQQSIESRADLLQKQRAREMAEEKERQSTSQRER